MKLWKVVASAAAVLVLAGIIVAMVFLLVGKKPYRHDKPKETIASLERSFNRYDLDGILDCLDGRYAAVIRGAITLAGKNWKLDSETISEVISLLVPNLPKLTDISERAMPKMDIRILEEKTEDDSSEIRANLTLRSNKSYVSNDTVFRLKKHGDDWLISSVGG